MLTEQIKRQPLKYNGSKYRLAPWIISFFPEHLTYVEPFGGGASILFRKDRSGYEVYNDLCGDVVNFFSQLRDNPKELIRALNFTPYSRQEYELSGELDSCSDLERARRFYVGCWQGRGNNLNKTSFRKVTNQVVGGHNPQMLFSKIRHLYAAARRFKGVAIESKPAIDILRMYDSENTLFYIDPPYVPGTRDNEKLYNLEMNAEQHIELAEKMSEVSGMVLLSAYESELYRELFIDKGWSIHKKDQNTMAHKIKTDCIYINPAAQKRAKQMRLFEN